MLMRTEGYAHQIADVEASWEKPGWARLWEMGVGKTWATLAEAVKLFKAGRLRTLIVIAPKAAAQNWVTDEIPRHMPEDLPYTCLAYDVPERHTKWHMAAVERLERYWLERRGLAILTVSYEGIMCEDAKELLKRLLCRVTYDANGAQKLHAYGDTMIVADEGSYISNITAQRTSRALSLSELAGFRRLLEGTPVKRDATNIYAEMLFVDPKFWESRGIHTYRAFVEEFCVINHDPNRAKVTVRDWRGGKKEIARPDIIGVKNHEKLNRWLLEGATRLTTEQAGINLPDKTYSRLKFQLGKKIQPIYDRMEKEMMVELESGHFMAVTQPMVVLTRLQQIASGYLPFTDPYGDTGVVEIVPAKENPRLNCIVERLETVPHQSIVFARYHPEIDMVADAIRGMGEKVVTFDGRTSTKDRQRNLDAFRGGEAKFIVGHVQAMGRSITLVNSKRTVYYSNTFAYDDRAQSEKRQHRIGQVDPVFYDDLEAMRLVNGRLRKTVDGRTIKSLLKKFDIANKITGDEVKEWLTDNG